MSNGFSDWYCCWKAASNGAAEPIGTRLPEASPANSNFPAVVRMPLPPPKPPDPGYLCCQATLPVL